MSLVETAVVVVVSGSAARLVVVWLVKTVSVPVSEVVVPIVPPPQLIRTNARTPTSSTIDRLKNGLRTSKRLEWKRCMVCLSNGVR
jgi:hypothetical protein